MSTFKYLSVFIVCLFLTTVSSQDKIDTALRDRYREEALAQHNLYRAQCKVESLQLNATLNDIAQNWCDDLVARNDFNHSGTTVHGENSYKQTPWDFVKDNGAIPVTYWFMERSRTKSQIPENNLHFTQVVWKLTKSLGVGVCVTKDNGILFVANYYPRGNYKDQFADNVLC